jgi:hypothetical protein
MRKYLKTARNLANFIVKLILANKPNQENYPVFTLIYFPR